MSTFNSVFFQKLFCEVHEIELFFAARAEPIRKTIACQTFPQKIHQIFLQKRETKEVHDAGRSQEGPAGVNSPGEKSSVPMVFFLFHKSLSVQERPCQEQSRRRSRDFPLPLSSIFSKSFSLVSASRQRRILAAADGPPTPFSVPTKAKESPLTF